MKERKRIYLCLAHMSDEGMEQKYVKEAFDTNWVVPLGPNVDGFEKALEEFIGENKRIVALASGTAAVHLALVECGVEAGDEVIVQSFTFCASSHPITYLGPLLFLWIRSPTLGIWTLICLKRQLWTELRKPGVSQRRLFLWHCTVCPTIATASWRLPIDTRYL